MNPDTHHPYSLPSFSDSPATCWSLPTQSNTALRCLAAGSGPVPMIPELPKHPPVRTGISLSLLQSRFQHPPPSDRLVPKDAPRRGFACAVLCRALPPAGPGQPLVTSARAACFSRASPQQKVHFTSEPPLSFTARALEPRSPQIRLLLPVAGDRAALCMLQCNPLFPSSETQRKSHLVCSSKAAHHLPPLQSYQEIRRGKKRH